MFNSIKKRVVHSIISSENNLIKTAIWSALLKNLSLRNIKKIYFSDILNEKNTARITLIETAIKRYPNNKFGYNELTKIDEKNKTIIRSKKEASEKKQKRIDNRINIAMGFAKNGDIETTLSLLTKIHLEFPSDRKILMRLGEVYQNDKNITAAHTYFKAAKINYHEYGAVRKLSFEIDNNLYDAANDSIKEILNFSTLSLLKFLPVINRASVYFPQYREEIVRARINVKNLLSDPDVKKGISATEQVKIALRCRWTDIAQDIIKKSQVSCTKVSSPTIEWFNTVLERTHSLKNIIDIAIKNDDGYNICGLLNGEVVEINRNYAKNKIIELFIPSVYFSGTESEKRSYSTVRELFTSVIESIIDFKDILIIPRNQWNWRQCDPLYTESYVISYHTINPLTQPGWVCIQESTISGKCSIDGKGFAGYSSLSIKDIEMKNQDITKKIKLKNDAFISRYINSNISKYDQKEFTSNNKPREPYVLLALQVATDIVSSLAYIDGISLLKELANYYMNKDETLVVKRHPYCKSLTIQRTLNELSSKKLIIISDDSIHSLIDGASIVFTVNSGVGLEAVMHNKKVILTGESDYSCCTTGIAKNRAELHHLIECGGNESYLRSSFLDYYLNEYTFYGNEREKIKNKLIATLGINNDA